MNLKHNKYKNIFFNTVMLYMLVIAKTFFSIITLPYLSRVLSVDCYGVVSYVRAVITYVQIAIDFGFMVSSVKDIVEAKNDKNSISQIIGSTVTSKLIISFVVISFVLFASNFVSLLKDNFIYLCLSLCVPLLSCFLMDFLFRGIEKMHIISINFVVMKAISTILTIVLVKNDGDVFLIPVFDILSSFVAIITTWIIVKRLGYHFKYTSLKVCFEKIKQSFSYFINSIASTAFGALNTVVIGICVLDTEQIAFWSVCMQLIGAIQSLYPPISNGIFPYMIRSKDLRMIRNILLIFVPVACIGAVICSVIAKDLLLIIAGAKYIGAVPVFRMLLPVVVISFPVVILGWPTLGAIDKVKETNISTIHGAVVQIAGLFVLIVMKRCTIMNVAILKIISESAMLVGRIKYVYKFRNLFINSGSSKIGGKNE